MKLKKKNYTKWKTSDKRPHNCVIDSTYIKCLMDKSKVTEVYELFPEASRIVGGIGRNKEWLQMGMGFVFWDNEIILKWDGADACDYTKTQRIVHFKRCEF